MTRRNDYDIFQDSPDLGNAVDADWLYEQIANRQIPPLYQSERERPQNEKRPTPVVVETKKVSPVKLSFWQRFGSKADHEWYKTYTKERKRVDRMLARE